MVFSVETMRNRALPSLQKFLLALAQRLLDLEVMQKADEAIVEARAFIGS